MPSIAVIRMIGEPPCAGTPAPAPPQVPAVKASADSQPTKGARPPGKDARPGGPTDAAAGGPPYAATSDTAGAAATCRWGNPMLATAPASDNPAATAIAVVNPSLNSCGDA
jgi:hypothetical protein